MKLVEHESIIWKRNHPQFKNVTMKEQAWGRVAYQLGISSESLFSFFISAQAYTHRWEPDQAFPILCPSALLCIIIITSTLHSVRLFPQSTCIALAANPITNSYICTRETNFYPSVRVYQFECLIFHRRYTTVLLMWRIKLKGVRLSFQDRFSRLLCVNKLPTR